MIRAAGEAGSRSLGQRSQTTWQKHSVLASLQLGPKNGLYKDSKPLKQIFLKKKKTKQVQVYLCCGWSLSTMCLHEYESFTVCVRAGHRATHIELHMRESNSLAPKRRLCALWWTLWMCVSQGYREYINRADSLYTVWLCSISLRGPLVEEMHNDLFSQRNSKPVKWLFCSI